MKPTCPDCLGLGNVLEDWWKAEDDGESGGGDEGGGKWGTLVVESKEFYKVSPVKCTSCDKYLGVWDHLENGQFYSIETLLADDTRKSKRWQRVSTHADRRVLFVLNQIVYNIMEKPNESELEFMYALPPQEDIAKLIWVDGEAVGFYTVKPKGMLDLETFEAYSMTTLDTIFVRKGYRRSGLGSSAIRNLITEFPGENIGFSFPISHSMLKVIKKHLVEHEEDRPRLWEVQGCGGSRDLRNLWVILRREVGG